MARTHRFQSPFEHWLSGLASEVVVFYVFIAVVAGLAALIAWAF